MSMIVQTEQLSKCFGDFLAVDGLNIYLQEEEIFSLLGPNGPGKSTAIKMKKYSFITQRNQGTMKATSKMLHQNVKRLPVWVKI